MFDDNDSESPLYGRQSEILSTLLTQLKKEGKNISSEAKDIHLKQITRIIRQFIDIADAFRASNVNALKSGRRTPEDTQTLVKLLSSMKTSLKQCQSNVHNIQSDLITGINEHQEVMKLRGENTRLQFKEMQGGPIHALRNLCNEQKRVLMNLEDENNHLRKSLELSKSRQSKELNDLKGKVAPLDEKMRRWQHDLADMKELSSINVKHTIDRLQFDISELNKKFRNFKLHHDEELMEARKASNTIRLAWQMHERRAKRLQVSYDSIMPYLYGQGIQTNLNYQKDHMTLAQGIDCLRVELDEFDKRYTLVTQELEMARAECHVLREKYMKKVIDGQKKVNENENAIQLRHVVEANEEQISTLKKRYIDDIERIKKDHEMELTYQLRNTVNAREREADQYYKERLERDLKNALKEIVTLKDKLRSDKINNNEVTPQELYQRQIHQEFLQQKKNDKSINPVSKHVQNSNYVEIKNPSYQLNNKKVRQTNTINSTILQTPTIISSMKESRRSSRKPPPPPSLFKEQKNEEITTSIKIPNNNDASPNAITTPESNIPSTELIIEKNTPPKKKRKALKKIEAVAYTAKAAAFFKKALIRKHIKTSSTSSNNTNNINENFSKNAYGSSSSATSPISNKSGTLSPSAKFNF